MVAGARALAVAVPGEPRPADRRLRLRPARHRRIDEVGCTIDVIDLGEGFPRPTAAAAAEALARLRQVPAGSPHHHRRACARGVARGRAGAARHPSGDRARASSARPRSRAHRRRRGAPSRERAHGACRRPSRHRHQRRDGARARRGLWRRERPSRWPCRATIAAQGAQGGTAAPSIFLRSGRWCGARATTCSLAALAHLADLDWHLVIAGDCTRDRETAGELATRIVMQRFSPRVRMPGVVSEQELAHLYVMPTYSCWPRATRAMAWRSPKRLRTGSPSSAPRRGPFRKRCLRAPASGSAG